MQDFFRLGPVPACFLDTTGSSVDSSDGLVTVEATSSQDGLYVVAVSGWLRKRIPNVLSGRRGSRRRLYRMAWDLWLDTSGS